MGRKSARLEERERKVEGAEPDLAEMRAAWRRGATDPPPFPFTNLLETPIPGLADAHGCGGLASGVVTLRAYRRGERVCEYRGPHCRASRLQCSDPDYTYVIYYRRPGGSSVYYVVDATHSDGYGRMINDCSRREWANCDVVPVEVERGVWRTFIYMLKDVPAFTELRWYYGEHKTYAWRPAAIAAEEQRERDQSLVPGPAPERWAVPAQFIQEQIRLLQPPAVDQHVHDEPAAPPPGDDLEPPVLVAQVQLPEDGLPTHQPPAQLAAPPAQQPPQIVDQPPALDDLAAGVNPSLRPSPVKQNAPPAPDGDPPSSAPRASKKKKKKKKAVHRCPHCSKVLSLKSGLDRHVRVHTGDRPFSCPQPECSAAFSALANMRAHVRNVHGDPQHLCTVCQKVFHSAPALKRHRDTVHELRPLSDKSTECRCCGKRFSRYDQLAAHRRTCRV